MLAGRSGRRIRAPRRVSHWFHRVDVMSTGKWWVQIQCTKRRWPCRVLIKMIPISKVPGVLFRPPFAKFTLKMHRTYLLRSYIEVRTRSFWSRKAPSCTEECVISSENGSQAKWKLIYEAWYLRPSSLSLKLKPAVLLCWNEGWLVRDTWEDWIRHGRTISWE